MKAKNVLKVVTAAVTTAFLSGCVPTNLRNVTFDNPMGKSIQLRDKYQNSGVSDVFQTTSYNEESGVIHVYPTIGSPTMILPSSYSSSYGEKAQKIIHGNIDYFNNQLQKVIPECTLSKLPTNGLSYCCALGENISYGEDNNGDGTLNTVSSNKNVYDINSIPQDFKNNYFMILRSATGE